MKSELESLRERADRAEVYPRERLYEFLFARRRPGVGGADGADSLGERYANENNIETLIFLPDWKKHGKMAGFIRNTDIIENAELVVAFWDKTSKGTKDSIDKATKLGKKVLIIPF